MIRYNILYNFPTRLRPGKFFRAVENIRQLSTNEIDYKILVKIDTDDYSMQTKEARAVLDQLVKSGELLISLGVSKNKIDAVNRGLDTCPYSWDIMVTMSDDMVFTERGFDDIIRSHMPEDLDWLLHFPDSYANERVCTMSIIGRNYYKRDWYVYHHDYYSMFCDEEQTEVAKIRGRYKLINTPRILDHNHYSNGRVRKDGLYKRNDTYRADQIIFNNRKAKNFFL